MRILVISSRVLALVALSMGCTGPTGPERELRVAPAISQVIVHPEIRMYGALLVQARPIALDFRLPSGRYLTAEVTTSRGDQETIILRREMCGADTCRRVIVWMSDGHLANEIDSGVRLLEARLVFHYLRTGIVWIFGNRDRTLAHLAALPGVAVAEFSGIMGPSAEENFDHYLAGAIPFDHGAIVPGDGFLTVADGDSIEVVYTDSFGVTSTDVVVLGTIAP